MPMMGRRLTPHTVASMLDEPTMMRKAHGECSTEVRYQGLATLKKGVIRPREKYSLKRVSRGGFSQLSPFRTDHPFYFNFKSTMTQAVLRKGVLVFVLIPVVLQSCLAITTNSAQPQQPYSSAPPKPTGRFGNDATIRREQRIEVMPRGGIGNRLRVVLSYLGQARHKKRRLVVYWVADRHCPGTFDSVFNISALPSDLIIESIHPRHDVFSTYSALPGNKITAMGPLALEVLTPNAKVQARSSVLLQDLGWPDRPFTAGKCMHTSQMVNNFAGVSTLSCIKYHTPPCGRSAPATHG